MGRSVDAGAGAIRLRDAVTQHGGVARVGALTVAGHRRHVIERAVNDGHLVRVRQGWVAGPDADPQLVAAARAGVVLTCVTQARRLGLWVLDQDRAHVGAPAHGGRISATGATVHWGRPVVPRHPDALVDPIENVLALIASCRPYESALATWESALRRGLVDAAVLGRFDLPAVARRLLHDARPFADSGLESIVVPRLRWMKLPLRRQIWIAGHRVDLLIGERLVLQIDGGHHVGSQRDRDVAHDAALMLMGYHVIRVGYAQVVHGWAEVQALIMRAVAQNLHVARS